MFVDVNKLKKKTVEFNKPGKYVVFLYNTSGDVEVNITSKGVEVDILGLYIGIADETYTIHTVQHHDVGESQSNLLIHGMFSDKSTFIYSGLIKIEKDAQLTHAYQKNQNVVLSEGVHIESDPFLEIEANDVFCTHGSTTGELPVDQLYYLANRGINQSDARKLLLRGFANKITSAIQELGYGNEIVEYEADIEKRLKML